MARPGVTFWHVYSRYDSNDPETNRRMKFARSCWLKTYGVRLKERGIPIGGTESFSDNGRTLPFVRHLLKVGAQLAQQGDAIILTNSDVCPPANIVGMLDLILERTDACYSYRRDFNQLTRPLSNDEIIAGHFNRGCEFFAFRKLWWLINGRNMPDMVLGAEGWDFAMRKLIDITQPGRMVSWSNLSYHEAHNSVWWRPENIRTLPSQLHNLKLAREFEAKHGLNEPSLH